MNQTLFQTICRTGIFMICAQAIVHFRPQESYEKYLKLLVSAMILVQLFLPVGSFFFRDGSQETLRQLEAFRESLEEGMRMAEEQATETDRILEQMTLEEVKTRMEELRKMQTEDNAGKQRTAEKNLQERENVLEDDTEDGTGDDTEDDTGDGSTAGVGKIEVEVEPVESIQIRGEEGKYEASFRNYYQEK